MPQTHPDNQAWHQLIPMKLITPIAAVAVLLIVINSLSTPAPRSAANDSILSDLPIPGGDKAERAVGQIVDRATTASVPWMQRGEKLVDKMGATLDAGLDSLEQDVPLDSDGDTNE